MTREGTAPLSSTSLAGVIPALITPFTADADFIDEEVLCEQVERCIQAGVDGLLVCGGTGEFTALTPAERRRVVEVVVEQTARRVPIIAHTGGLTSAETIGYSIAAVDAGASSIMLGVPFYEPLSERQTISYFRTVATAIDTDIMYYNYPYASGFNLDHNALVRLTSEVPAVRSLKDSSGNFTQLAAVIQAVPSVGVFAGSDTLAGPALLCGAAGLINGCANIVPEIFAEMYRSSQSGDDAVVVSIWRDLLPLLTFLETHPFVSAVKTACELRGYRVGPVRDPLDVLGVEDKQELRSNVDRLVNSTSS